MIASRKLTAVALSASLVLGPELASAGPTLRAAVAARPAAPAVLAAAPRQPAGATLGLPAFSISAHLPVLAKPAAPRETLAALEAPAAAALRALTARGLALPESAATWQDAASLRALAREVPEHAEVFQGMAKTVEASRSNRAVSGAVATARELTADQVRFSPDLSKLPESTAAVERAPKRAVGQEAADRGVRYSLKIRGQQYNAVVVGSTGSGKRLLVKQNLDEIAAEMPTPRGFVSVTNFEDKEKPVFLEPEAGQEKAFAASVQAFVAAAKKELPAVLKEEALVSRQKALGAAGDAESEADMQALNEAAERTPLAGGLFHVVFIGVQTEQGNTRLVAAPAYKGQHLYDKKAVAQLIEQKAFSVEQFQQAMMEGSEEVLRQTHPELFEKRDEMLKTRAERMTRVFQAIAELQKKAVLRKLDELGAGFKASLDPWRRAFDAKVAAVSSDDLGLKVIETPNGPKIGRSYKGETFSDGPARLVRAGVSPESVEASGRALDAKAAELEKELAAHLKAPQAGLSEQDKKILEWADSAVAFSREKFAIFFPHDAEGPEKIQPMPGQKPVDAADFFEVSVFTDRAGLKGKPVVVVSNPTYEGVFGRVEDNRPGFMLPNGNVIRGQAPGGPSFVPAAVHKARDGFLFIEADVENYIGEPRLWTALMAMARTRLAESAVDGLNGLVMGKGTFYHVPIGETKVVLRMTPALIALLRKNDKDFAQYFTAVTQLEPLLPVNDEVVAAYVQFMKSTVHELAEELGQKPVELDKSGIAAVVEFAARLAGSNAELTSQFRPLARLIREATYWAVEAGKSMVGRDDVEKAVAQREEREEVGVRRLREGFESGREIADTAGEKVGQINGLAVLGAHPGIILRTTAIAFVGDKGVVAIDGPAGMLGEMATKTAANIGGRIAADVGEGLMRQIQVNLSYEQSHGVEGDSASMTENLVALSALSGIPIKQNLAITGSLDQLGNVQVIGGAIEKIEAFFALCKARGLTGEQGVVLPRGNVVDLQLNREIADAVAAGKFHIYPVDRIEQAAKLMLGRPYDEIIVAARAGAEKLITDAATTGGRIKKAAEPKPEEKPITRWQAVRRLLGLKIG